MDGLELKGAVSISGQGTVAGAELQVGSKVVSPMAQPGDIE